MQVGGTPGFGRPALRLWVVALWALMALLVSPTRGWAQSTPPWSWVCPQGGWGGSGPRPNCGAHPAPRPSPYRRSSGPSADDAEIQRYNQLWSQAQAAFADKNYALALSLFQQAEAMRNGPAAKANIALVQALIAWSSDPRAALAYLIQRRQYLNQYNVAESAGLRAANETYIAELTKAVDALDQAAADEHDHAEAALTSSIAVARYRAEAAAAAAAAAQRQAAAIAAADRKVQAYEAGAGGVDAAFASAKASAGAPMSSQDGAGSEAAGPANRFVSRDGRTYQASGNGMIGGTAWITGFNVQGADPAVAKRAHEMMAEQMRLAGMPYADGVDFQRYNFVLGIAASTDIPVDLATRVVFDEYRNGEYSAENQAAYDSLKGRQFDELACHSNGAMVCLAALENHDIVADKVVLYGPQITVESLKMWDELIRQGKVRSVQIYANGGDPVPPLSLAFGGGSVGAYAVASVALMRPASFVDVIHQAAPDIAVSTLPCASRPDLSCHGMEVYRTNVQRAACTASSPARPATPVAGTALPGRRETAYAEPPSPC
jgi:hypothetical protein